MGALDASPEMLQKAMEDNLYHNYYNCILGRGHTIAQIPADTYDCIIACGVFAPNHMSTDVFPEIIRITKPGGLILFARGLDYGPEFTNLGPAFDDDVERLVNAGKWAHRIESFEVCKYLGGRKGRIYVMEKTNSA